jgi:serine/threonine-protein kinase
MNLFCPECSRTYDDPTLKDCPEDGTRLFEVDPDEDVLIGAIIDGRFKINKRVGEGGMGTVYLARQISVNRDVAVKVLRPELTNRKIALERFHRESKLISQLNHPNIVRLIDFGEDRDRDLLYLVMEFVNGFNLADLIKRGRLRTTLALDILQQCSAALTEPHAAGIIHRDLKPDNIIISPMSDGTIQAKVLDFGIARALEANTQLTSTGMVCGTPSYMAPEQAQNEELDARADLYALGVIFYEMLSGWPPFSGTNSLQIIIKHIQEAPKPLREFLPPTALPEDVEDFVNIMMSKSRQDRPNSARAVRERALALRSQLKLEPPPVEANFTLEDAAKAWLLPKLPNPDFRESGPTSVLRRETGTDWDKPTDLYVPHTPDENDSVRVPAVETRQGGQQAWTPGQVGAMKPKVAVTLRENTPEAEPIPDVRPATPSTSERPSVALQSNVDNSLGKLTITAILLAAVTLCVAIGVVIWVLNRAPEVEAAKVEPTPTKTTIIAEPPVLPTPSAVPVETVVELARLRLERATVSSQQILASMPAAERPKTQVPVSKTKVVRTPSPVVESQVKAEEPRKTEEPRTKTRTKLTEEDVMKNLRGGE